MHGEVRASTYKLAKSTIFQVQIIFKKVLSMKRDCFTGFGCV